MTMPQYAVIEQPFGCSVPVIHCPLCGISVIKWRNNNNSVCSHLVFVYLLSAREFNYKAPKFQQRMEDIRSEEVTFYDFHGWLRKVGYDDKLFVLEVHYTSSMGTGQWIIDVYGFEFDTLALI